MNPVSRPPLTVDTVVPPPSEQPGTSSYDQPSLHSTDDGYYCPKDTINQDVVRSADAVRRASSMQTPRQFLLSPRLQHSWTAEISQKSPTIVISPPSEEHLPPLPIHTSVPVSKHRQSMAIAGCLALFVVCTVVVLIYLFVNMS